MTCNHFWECGCDKTVCEKCVDLDGEMCMVDECKNYYKYRNDNCNCNGQDCPYCQMKRSGNYPNKPPPPLKSPLNIYKTQ